MKYIFNARAGIRADQRLKKEKIKPMTNLVKVQGLTLQNNEGLTQKKYIIPIDALGFWKHNCVWEVGYLFSIIFFIFIFS